MTSKPMATKIDWLRQHRPFANGIPRRHTGARILRCIIDTWTKPVAVLGQ